MVQKIDESHLVSLFIAGLKPEIKLEVQVNKPLNVMAAYRVATAREAIAQEWRKQLSIKPFTHRSLPSSSHSPPLTVSSAAGKTWSIQRLTPQQIQEKKDKGLCFNCDEKYFRGHKCASKCRTLLLIEANEEEELLAEDDPVPPNEEENKVPEPEPPPQNTHDVSLHSI